MPQYNKAEIALSAKKYGFVRDTFEKVLRLTEILKFVNEDDLLKPHLLLKGGTAINLTIFNMPRLSVDIDMDYTPNDHKDDMLRTRERISKRINNYMYSEGYMLSENSRYTNSLDALYYNYQNSGGNSDSIKIEINYSLRAHILNPVTATILPQILTDNITINTLDPIEIFAAKGNALLNRAAARDLYDWGNLIDSKLFQGERDLFRKSFVFYATISSESIDNIFDTSALDSLQFKKIRRDLFPMLGKKEKFNTEERKTQAKDYIKELLRLSEKEEEYIKRFTNNKYIPELLFDDNDILQRIKNHPMALWKCRK